MKLQHQCSKIGMVFKYVDYPDIPYHITLRKFCVNEVTLREQDLPLKCCQSLNFQYDTLKDLGLLILQILNLWVKWL